MRTTLNLDEDVLDDLKQYAKSRSLTLGAAASDLLRRGLSATVQTRLVNGIYTFVLPEDTPKVTSERVKQLLEDEV